MTGYLAFPYAIAANGRTQMVDYDRYIVQLLAQVVFVQQGERVNRPDFGSNILGLPFSSGARELASAMEAFLHASLRQGAGDVVDITGVDIAAVDAIYTVTITYRDKRNQALRQVALRSDGAVA